MDRAIGFPVRKPQWLEPKCDFKMSLALLWLAAAGLVVGAWALNDTSCKQYALRTVLTQVCTNNKPLLLHCGDSPNRNQRTNEFLIYVAVALNQKPQVPQPYPFKFPIDVLTATVFSITDVSWSWELIFFFYYEIFLY